MGKINVLGFDVANLIAAGEVVERPSSVLKELIENSIDSGATEIVAEIKRGGVALIRVTDNGSGMEKDDLPISIKRHATSKIKDKDDLETIMTLGFRGEALAAISSVSVMTIITKTASMQDGAMLVSEAGEIVELADVGAANGTTVVVENLFYNVPARRKFLKKDATEAANVAALVEKIALSRPDISIQLLIDGEERFKTPGTNDLLKTVSAVYGKDFASKLIEVKSEMNGIKVSGFVGRSDNARKNRNLENIFINGRFVKSLTAMAALEKAFTSYIAPECFPVCALFIEMRPNNIDVNVHPAKLEVKFSDERVVFEAVYYAVKAAIEGYEYRPEMTLTQKKNDRNALGAFVPVGDNVKPYQPTLSGAFDKPKVVERLDVAPSPVTPKYPQNVNVASPKGEIKSTLGEQMTPKQSLELLQKLKDIKELDVQSKPDAIAPETTCETKTAMQEVKENNTEREEGEICYRYIGEAFDCYVIIEHEGRLLIIDKHAAHERVIFEDLKALMLKDGRVAYQSLLLPISVSLTPDETDVLRVYESDIKSVGFEYSVTSFGADISAIPSSISSFDAESLFVKMIDEIKTGVGNPQNTETLRREKALYQVACKAAIKGGRQYTREVIDWLIDKLLRLPDITVCPHGRPVAFTLKKSEIDRQFDRIK